MKKNILIISSDHTGHGHKSITESICEKMNNNHDVKIHVVDGFSLGGEPLLKIGKSYAPITRHSERLWGVIWKTSAHTPNLVNKSVEILIRQNFLKVVREVKPDLILSVHPNFNGSVVNILEKENIKIPFVTLIADLVNIYPLWAEKRVDYIISPTKEAKEKCVKFGVPPQKVKILGFPVRQRFFRKTENHYDGKRPLKFLIMSGGEGVGNMKTIAENLLEQYDCTVRIIAGRNKKMRAKLEQSLLSKYGNKVEIFGFIKDIQELMLDSDVAFTRGSPNVMFEAIAANLPIVITGALPGQEADNPLFAQNSNLGVICKKPKNIIQVINHLIENNGERLNKIKNSQKEFINEYAAENILKFLLDIESNSLYEEKLEYEISLN